MKEVAGRIVALYADLAELAGVDVDPLVVDLPLALDDVEERFSYAATATFVERIAACLGGTAALGDAFARLEGAAPDLVAVAGAVPSLLDVARFVNTKITPAHFSCHRYDFEVVAPLVYRLRVRLAPGYAPSRAIVAATVGLLRGQPRLLDLPEATVLVTGPDDDFVCEVTLPDAPGEASPPRSLTGREGRRAGDLLGALLADRTHYRRDSLRLGRALVRLGRDAYLDTDLATFADAVARAVRGDLGHDFAEVWIDQGGARDLTAASGTRQGTVLEIPLIVGEQNIGALVTDDRDGRETLEPLARLIALALHRRRIRDERSSPEGLFPAGWKLTPRQREVAEQIAAGAANGAIAATLGCAVATVEDHVGTIYAKTGVEGRQLLAAAIHAFRRSPRGKPG